MKDFNVKVGSYLEINKKEVTAEFLVEQIAEKFSRPTFSNLDYFHCIVEIIDFDDIDGQTYLKIKYLFRLKRFDVFDEIPGLTQLPDGIIRQIPVDFFVKSNAIGEIQENQIRHLSELATSELIRPREPEEIEPEMEPGDTVSEDMEEEMKKEYTFEIKDDDLKSLMVISDIVPGMVWQTLNALVDNTKHLAFAFVDKNTVYHILDFLGQRFSKKITQDDIGQNWVQAITYFLFKNPEFIKSLDHFDLSTFSTYESIKKIKE